MRTVVCVVPLVLSLAAACSAVDQAAVDEPTAGLDEQTFRCTVEPILVRDCSYEACHGNAGQALRVYSIGKLRGPDVRQDGIDTSTLSGRQQALTAGSRCGQHSDERHANYLSATGFAYEGTPATENLLLRKVLPAELGGYAHKGGAIFSGASDPRAIAIHDWLSGSKQTCAAIVCPTGGAP